MSKNPRVFKMMADNPGSVLDQIMHISLEEIVPVATLYRGSTCVQLVKRIKALFQVEQPMQAGYDDDSSSKPQELPKMG